MTRITTAVNDRQKPRIEHEDVLDFFEHRARRINTVGPMQAVIYQDKHPDLAKQRDHAEKERIFPLLGLDGSQRLLDVGCGTGRWTQVLSGRLAHYHGIDFSPGLLAYARNALPETAKLRFSVASADDYSLASLSENQPFDRILCVGVMVYLNDNEVDAAMRSMVAVSARNARIVLREPMAVGARLTIRQHYSDELEEDYNAIYRTEAELEEMMTPTLLAAGFRISGSGDMYSEAALNNRLETRQRWMTLERA